MPKTHVDYTRVGAAFKPGEKVAIVCPSGRPGTGHLYFGIAGYGPYWQIVADSPLPVAQFNLGQRVRVEMTRLPTGACVELRPA